MFKKFAMLGVIFAVTLLAGCTVPLRPSPDNSLQREAIKGSHKPVPQPLNVGTAQQTQSLTATPAPETWYGTGVFVNPAPAHAKSVGGTNAGGTITYNFENTPVQVVVKTTLGDVLHANYAISPKVKGTVTFATSQPVTQAQVLPILQMLLSWTGNALVHQNGGYLVEPIEQAAPGNLVPSLDAVSPGAGYAARLFPLHYVSAEAMRRLLKPFADPRAFLLVDPLRNLLVMGGTPNELANYQRIIGTFDVDWLRGMSVAVIPLQHVQAADLVSQLNTLFTEQGSSGNDEGPAKIPTSGNLTLTIGHANSGGIGNTGNLSGMVRLIPLQHSNSLVIITPQPSYISEVRRLVTTIDNGAGNSSGLYVYNVLNVKASDLARHLNELFGNSTGGAGSQGQAGAVAPGFSPLEQSSPGGLGAQRGFGNFSSDNNSGGGEFGSSGGLGGGGGVGAGVVEGATQNRRQQSGQRSSVAFTTSSGVRIAAVNENNQLLVRAKAGQWEKLVPVIERLDEKPLQVQIETKVLEVTLSGEFQFGVQYYLGGLIGTQPGSPPNTNQSFHRHQGAAGFGGVQYNPLTDALFYSFAGNNLQFALRAMENSGNTKVLSAPSTVVLNNQETTFKVGDKIPVVQTSIIPGVGGSGLPGSVNATSVQYIDTGVLLDVVPRVSPGGLVYMDIQQVVSKPTSQDQFGNFTIANRALSTEVAVQSGQTVLLGGLIQQTDTTGNTGVPFLDRIPVLGHLFGTTDHKKTRTELIVLITPHIIRDPEDARRVTDEYETQFESLRPILPKANSAPASDTPTSVPTDEFGAPPARAKPTAATTEPAKEKAAAVLPGSWSVQVTSFTRDADAERLRGRLQQLGFTSYLDNVSTAAGPRWRVFAGPVVDRNVAIRVRDSIAGTLHIKGMRITRQ